MRCSRMCLLSTGRPVRRGHLRVQGHGWRAGSQGRGPAGARQDRRGTCGRPSVPGSSPRWHGGEACAGQEGGHAEVAAWDRQAPMAAVSSVSVVVHTETPARSAAVKLGTWRRVLCPVSQHVTWRGNPVRRVAWKPRCVAWRGNPGVSRGAETPGSWRQSEVAVQGPACPAQASGTALSGLRSPMSQRAQLGCPHGCPVLRGAVLLSFVTSKADCPGRAGEGRHPGRSHARHVARAVLSRGPRAPARRPGTPQGTEVEEPLASSLGSCCEVGQ